MIVNYIYFDEIEEFNMFREELLSINERLSKLEKKFKTTKTRAIVNAKKIGRVAAEEPTKAYVDSLKSSYENEIKEKDEQIKKLVQAIQELNSHTKVNKIADEVTIEVTQSHINLLHDQIIESNRKFEDLKERHQRSLRTNDELTIEIGNLVAEIDQTNIEKSIIIEEQKKEIQVLKDALEKKEEMILKISQKQTELTREYRSLLNGGNNV